jgi:hypothetical protein
MVKPNALRLGTSTGTLAGDGTMKTEGGVGAPDRPAPIPRRRLLPFWVGLFGVVSLSYLLGAAVMFFHLPSADFLHKAFSGARAWREQGELPVQPPATSLPVVTLGKVDKPGKTYDGFTLCTYASRANTSTQAFLMNMRGEVVHTWNAPFSRVWPEAPHLRRQVKDSLVAFFDCYLYPNGDLLATFHGMEEVPNGYGLVKLDKDSKVLWKYSANIHHDVDVAEDGTIYALQHALAREMPKGLEYIPAPSLVDSLLVLSPEGKLIGQPMPILEAFRDSPYSPLLASLAPLARRTFTEGLALPRLVDNLRTGDTLHTNCVHVLPRRLAQRFPAFKAGQVLISLRHLDTIAVLDPDRRSVVWAARGPWEAQHDAHFLDNGHLLLFDNLGSPLGSRVLEYDPQTGAFPWSYSGENHAPFFSDTRGMSQRLPNGNTLIVDSQAGELFEVTHDKEVVWSCSFQGFIHVGRRYGPDQLHFLEGGTRARP